jgi:hypothetical protein
LIDITTGGDNKMAMRDETELKAHITAMLVVHGRMVSGGEAGAVREALSVHEAAQLAVEIIHVSGRTYPPRR